MRMLARVPPFLWALLIASLIANVSLFLSPYKWEQDKYPPGEHGSNQTDANQPISKKSETAGRVQIDCNPNCAAQEADNHGNESALARFIRKTLDDPLTAFTGVLAVATFILAIYTGTVATATKQAAEHIPRAERAYIYGGVGFKYLVGCDDLDVRLGVNFSMANYGKTPGFITRIEVGTGDLRDIDPQQQPIYDPIPFNVSDLYFPQMKMDDVRPSGACVSVPRYVQPVVFQRVHYRDVFGKNHFSGSIYRLFIVQFHDRYFVSDEVALPGSPYWDWDKEDQE
jgi:hypothetical protein